MGRSEPEQPLRVAEEEEMIDHDRLQELIGALYSTVEQLEVMFPGRHFTPDGHMVGSIGECLIADAYGLELMPASNQGFDAVAPDWTQVEIKATQSNSVAFRSAPEHVIVIKILPSGTFDDVYSGPGDVVWQQFKGKPRPSNGQYQISLNKLKALLDSINSSSRLERTS